MDALVFLSSLTVMVGKMVAGGPADHNNLKSLNRVSRPNHADRLAFEVGCRRLQWLLAAPPSMHLRSATVI